jgi:hypothetical protein
MLHVITQKIVFLRLSQRITSVGRFRRFVEGGRDPRDLVMSIAGG